jgi:hypothetical protein
MSVHVPILIENASESPPPIQPEPIAVEPLAFLPPNISDFRLAQPYSTSSSNPLGRIPTREELLKELEGEA